MEPQEPRTVKDVPADAFISAYADYLKKTDKLELPAWVDIVKTGISKELCPFDKDWLYIRTASIARKVYLRPHLGVGAFRKIYGGTKNMGTSPSHTVSASGKIIRYCLAQLEKMGVVQKAPPKAKSLRTGRKITPIGQRELNTIARQVTTRS
jgi:small subunit ribosomal protein S19e